MPLSPCQPIPASPCPHGLHHARHKVALGALSHGVSEVFAKWHVGLDVHAWNKRVHEDQFAMLSATLVLINAVLDPHAVLEIAYPLIGSDAPGARAIDIDR